MSSFGSQARAAEYGAAMAARARQVSREAEDQRLPPKAASISLTAFTKTQAINRNKGQKAWKPLNLDEIAESSDDTSNDQVSGRSTPIPTPQPNALDRTPSYSQRRVTSYAGIVPSPIPIPVAPRAMVRPNAPNTILANPTPQRQVSYPIVNLPPMQERQGVQDTPSPAYYGGLPYRVANRYHYLRQPVSLVSPARGDALSLPKHDSMMTPDDLSPAKQEDKFARLSSTQDPQYPPQHFVSNDTSDNTFSNQAASNNLPYQHQQSEHYYLPSYENGTYTYDAVDNDNSYSTPNFTNQRAQRQARNLYETDDQHKDVGYGQGTQMQTNLMIPVYYDGIGDFDRSSFLSNQAHYFDERNRIIKEACLSKLQKTRTPLEIKAPNQFTQSNQPGPSIVKTEEEPYDRNGKMQTFVAEATQEALSRKGKTVLHNPELHKQQDQRKSMRSYQSPEQVDQERKALSEAHQTQQDLRPVPWPLASRETKVTVQAAPPSTSKEEAILRSTNSSADESNATVKPPPGFEHLQNLRLNTEEEPIDTISRPADGVGSFAWCQLRPFNEADRTRTRACMVKAAATLTTKIPQPPMFGESNGQSVNEANLSHSVDWFRSNERGEQRLSYFQPLQKLRAQLPEIAEKHAVSRRNIAATANGGDLPGDFRVGIDGGYTTSVLLGEVAANLLSYSCGDHKSEEQRRNFHKVKSVPEFAIERGGVLGAVPGASETIFDDEGGFQGAPVRIARDPRFRPQGKEGLKLKPEEEWRDRHEMYGRRMM